MPKNEEKLPFNPFIHGTSSQTLSLMQSTAYQLMPVLAMLQDFKTAPMVGELTQGGYSDLWTGSNRDTVAGAPSFGRIRHAHYDLPRIIKGFTRYSKATNLETHKGNFKKIVAHSHKVAFSNLNLLMIYLGRLRQFGVKVSDVMPLDEIDTLKARLNASIQFYYFILCIQKYIFINGKAMEQFRQENDLDDCFDLADHMEHFFSFENFLEKLRKTPFDIEAIYKAPSPDNINKLLEFVKISEGFEGKVKKYSSGEAHFRAKRDYHFFTSERQELGFEEYRGAMHWYFFKNTPGYTLGYYLQIHHIAYSCAEEKNTPIPLPNFEAFHTQVLPHIDAMKDRVQLCEELLDAHDEDFVAYHKEDELITKPFPVVFVTEVDTLEDVGEEYRSPVPLRLGKEILLVATDNTHHQKRLRDYLQKNNVGPVEVLLFDDLKTLCSEKYQSNYFDAFVNEDLIRAFELAKEQNCVAQFSKLYRALSELNEKRYRFKSTNQEMYEKLNGLFTDLQCSVLTPDKDKINFEGIRDVLQYNKQENYTLYATHRGVLGLIDTSLTILASLGIFYPITYFVQKIRHSPHTFFATDTEKKVNYAIEAADEVINQSPAAAI